MANKLVVAVIHYHLRPGGVARVIERAVESLGNAVDLLVLTGEAPAPDAALTSISEPFPALGYSESRPSNTEELADDLRFTARSLMGRDPDIWHIHNHSLGKNSFTPQLAWHLANAGCRLLLQPHDFAEDGRPENYRLLKEHLGGALDNILYPVADHVWYAPINCRDNGFLKGIGLPNVHELPNAITAHRGSTVPDDSSKTIVYPARAIRRKNMGEFLLWSLLAPEGYRFISTLAPQNPKWLGIYNEWVAFAEALGLPVDFDVGRTTEFSELVQNAEALISTSIAEGFGLAFLEPWLEGKMLIGRNIPGITADFAEAGLDLSTLYSSLPVPLEWAGEAQFLQALETAMRRSYDSYSRKWNPKYFEQAKAMLVVDGKVDFGILDEPLQRSVIRHLAQNPADKATLPSFLPLQPQRLIGNNQKVVRDRYSLEVYGERLLGIYQQLAATRPGKVSAGNATGLLNEFLQPERFNLLRT